MNKKLIDWWTGGGFTPQSLSPLSWWDNGATYMASDGSQWTDRVSGNNLTAAGVARPTFTAAQQNGLPCFTFDGTNNIMQKSRINAIQNIAGLTIWVVGRRFGVSHFNTATARTELMQFTDNAIYGIIANGSNSYGSFAHSNAVSYSMIIFDGSQGTNATRLVMYVNGVARTLSFTLTIPATTENAASTLSVSNTGLTKLAGVVYEIGMVTRAITSTEATNLNTYLASKYAL